MELKFKPDALRELRDLRGFVRSGRRFGRSRLRGWFSERVDGLDVIVVGSI
jgi:hypothetical protein